MGEMDFKPSSEVSVGVELELQLVRPHDLDLSREAAALIGRLEQRGLPGAVKPEITESMIELNTSVHARHDSLRAELEAMRDAVLKEAGVLNLRVCGGGSHPFHDWTDRRIFPTERFKHLLERYGYLAKQFTVFGQHIHVGCPGGDEAVSLVHALTRYVPHLIALAAASPYDQGEDTAFQSSRLNVVNAFPLSGHMPFVRDWAQFLEYFGTMKGFGIVESMKDFYWDVRPKPEFGTVEIRVCDTPLAVGRAAALAAYAQAIAAQHFAERRAPAPAVYLVNSHNRFEACRYGLRGELIDPADGRKKRIGEDVLDAVAALMPHARGLGGAEALAALAGEIRRGEPSDADWLRERCRAGGSLADAVRAACERWERG